MNTSQIIKTLLEVAAISFVMWGLFNENKLIHFENKIRELIRKK